MAVNITIRSLYRLARIASSACFSRSPEVPLALTITCRLSGSMARPTVLTTLGTGQRRRMAVDVDDRKLRARHRYAAARPASSAACSRGWSAAGSSGSRPSAGRGRI